MTIPCLDQRTGSTLLRIGHSVRLAMEHAAQNWIGRGIALVVLTLSSPLIGLAFLFGYRLQWSTQIGRHGRRIACARLSKAERPAPGIGNLPLLWNIVRDELAWVGPAARDIKQTDLKNENQRRLTRVAPGLVSSWWVRKRTNIAYGSELEADLEFIADDTWRERLGILLRAALAALYGAAAEETAPVVRILDLPVDNLTLHEAVARILMPRQQAVQVSFLNVDCINKAVKDREYHAILASSALRLADGIGLRIAGKILRSQIRENVNGTDLFGPLCERMQTKGLRVYLLGGRPGVVEAVTDALNRQYPQLTIAGCRHGYFQASEEESVLAEIEESRADVLLVAFGAPLQEKWICRHLHRLRVRAALGVGGLFDFVSGRIPRAPHWLRELGLEWTYRLYQEPGRMWRRYLVGNFVFLCRVCLARYFRSSNLAVSEVNQ